MNINRLGTAMKRSGWAGKVAVFATATALACVAIAATSTARADYNYNFTLTPIDANGLSASGSFTALTDPSLGNSYVTNQGGTYVTSGGWINTFSGTRFPGTFSNTSVTFYRLGGIDLAFGGSIVTTGLESKGVVSTTNPVFGAAPLQGTSIFDAFLTSVSGSGGGGGGSGGVPTPEVNAGLGVLLAGASFAFLRRKRGSRSGTTAA